MTARRTSGRVLAFALALGGVAAVAQPGCGGGDEKQLFVRPLDAGGDGDAAEEKLPDVDPTIGGPCTDDVQCDDKIPCTFDRCDQTIARCRNVPDDTQCDDQTYCNGREVCLLRQGCAPGPVVTCQDDSFCTIDRCSEATKACEHKPRDIDGDGDPDEHCVGKADCDDLDPNIGSKHSEVCGNFIDDNCDGRVDEVGCVQAANDVCATALSVTASGTYLLSTVATRKDYATTCSVTTPSSAKDVVVKIVVPGAVGDAPKDVEIWANAQVSTNEVAVALQTTCGQAATEVGCGHVDASPSARAILRGAPAGSTLSAVITSQLEGAVDLKVDIRAATTAPTNESCAAPQSVPLETPFTVSLIDPAKDVPTDCDASKTGELTYSFTLAAPQDVRIFASTLVGSGTPVVSLRDATCTGELRCKVGSTVPVFARNLAAGTHVFTVSGTRQIDASVLVKAYPPTAAPPNQTCATAPPIATNTTVTVDLSAQEDAIKNGCLPGGAAAAYDLTLTQPSDVLVIGRFAQNELGGISLNTIGCTTADVLQCAKGASPQRVTKRNLPAGTYRVVVADELGQNAQVSVLVRPAVAPTSVGASDGCASPFAIPAAGGFFTGNTTSSSADFNASCDAPGQPIGGSRDQLLKLDLTQQRRVVFDMSGSVYTTLLDLRKGTSCPGIEVPNACHVGFQASRSFLDLTLAAGTYFVQVDGYSADKGAWNLDVRVLPP